MAENSESQSSVVTPEGGAHPSVGPREAPSTHSREQAAGIPAAEKSLGAGSLRAEGSFPSAGSSVGQPADEARTVISRRAAASEELPAILGGSALELGRQLEGKRLGHYQLERYVGGGGMGAVFRATDTALGRTVAVKVLSGNQNDPEIVRRFRNEGQSAARLDHENIARVFDVGEDAGCQYIVFEFIEGINVRDLVVEEGPLSLAAAIHYSLNVAEALQHAHDREVVHRDIKPSNLIVTREGRCKLVDMGLARLHQVEASSDDLTASGVTLGTFDYISPEQARDPRNADVRSDLYSLGCTLFFMLTGRPPYPEGTVLQKLLSHSGDEVPDIDNFRSGVPREMSRILNRLLAKQPSARYQQPNELIGELLLLASDLGLEQATRGSRVWIEAGDRPRQWWERLLPPLAGVALLVAAALLFDSFLDGSSSETPAAFFERPPTAGITPREIQIPGRENQPLSPPNGGNTSLPVDSGPAPTQPATEEQGPTTGGVAASSPGGGENETSPSPAGEGLPNANPGRPAESGATPLAVSRPADGSSGSETFGPLPSQGTLDPAEAKILYVGRPEAPVPEDGMIVEDLAAALGIAAEYAEIGVIELCFNGSVATKPFSLDASSLTLRAGSGFEPVLTFTPVDRVTQPGMVELVGGDVSIQGVHLRLELPVSPADGWSLFRLRDARRLTLTGCTLTIVNVAGDGLTPLHEVAFFDIRQTVADGMAEEMLGPIGAETRLPKAEPTTAVNLFDVVARGEATFLDAAQTSQLELYWLNGLLISSEQLLFSRGAATAAKDPRISVILEHVTAYIPKGLCSVVCETDAVQPLLDVDCRHCVVETGELAPLLEQRGFESLSETRGKVRFDGMWNIYPRTLNFWRLDAGDGSSAATVSFEEWAQLWERHPPSRNAAWQAPATADVPVHRRSVANYTRLENTGDNVNYESAGFEADDLPRLP